MSDRIAVTHLDHVTLRVPDPEESAAYYTRVLGLVEVGRDADGAAIRLSCLPSSAGTISAHEIILYKGGGPGPLDHHALAVPNQTALQRAADVLRRRGLDVEGPRAFETVHGPAVRLRDGDGLLFELTVPLPPVARPAGARPFSFVKLSHVNLRSPDPARGAAWWETHIDLRLTEYIPETFYWLRCNPEHTHVALVRGPQAGLHHIGFIIESWNDVKFMLDHLASNGVRVEYGPGRHGPGNSIFVYFIDPFGVRWEALCEMELIHNDATHKVKVWDQTAGRLSAVNLWGGPTPPETFK